MYVCVGDFLKTKRTKSAAIRLKSLQKAGFLNPMSSKITPTKEKERKKERARRKKGGKEKKAMVALLVFIMATLEIVFGRK